MINLRRIILTVLTLLSLFFISLALYQSTNEPQAPTLLDLLQTDLTLQASKWQPESEDQLWQNLKTLTSENNADKAYDQALTSYRSAREANLAEMQRQDSSAATAKLFSEQPDQQLGSKVEQAIKADLLNQLDIRIGVLQALEQKVGQAKITWEQIRLSNPESQGAETAKVLLGLWSNPIVILPDAEAELKRSLDRWSQSATLARLYESQQRSQELAEVRSQEQIDAQNALTRLLTATAVPILGGIGGILIWLGLIGQKLLSLGNGSKKAILSWSDRPAIADHIPESSSLTLEKTWEVMVLWFTAYVLVSRLLPQAIALCSELLLKLNIQLSPERYQAIIGVLLPYCLTMLPMLPIISLSLHLAKPLPPNWLKISLQPWNWLLWGVGGYFAAAPLVFLASWLSQQVLQGQGGSNPLLPILVESQDNLAKFILWVTIAIAAPFFEEYLFRGFLLTSLRQQLPLGLALLISGFGFAIVHLNLGDLLPLTILGVMMGLVYYRSKNLMAPMLLHCLWNTGSFVALLALGAS